MNYGEGEWDGLFMRKEEGKVYLLKDSYYELSGEGKFIIDEIIRFCEEKGRFPKEKEISKKNGYIGRTRIYKHFNTNTFCVVYNYIEKVEEEKPETMICTTCGKEKEFTSEFFGTKKRYKFGLGHECKECANEKKILVYFKKKGYNISSIEDLSVYDWYESFLENKIRKMPKKFLNEDCYSKVIRYVILKKNKTPLRKEDILNMFKTNFLKENKLSTWVYEMGGKIACLNKCFSEFNFTNDDMIKYTEVEDMEILGNKLKELSVSVDDILEGRFNIRSDKDLRNLLSRNMIKGIGTNDIYLKYFKYKNIKHPKSKRDICIFDFKNKPNGFFNKRENRIGMIKYYCEIICDVSILNVIDNTTELVKWVEKYFKQKDISKVMCYNKHYPSLYSCLVDAYPDIVENKILFEWEWSQFNLNTKDVLLKELRDFVTFRIPNIKNIKEEAPKYINRTYISLTYPKLIKHIDKNRFDNFYEWAIEAFPEYKDYWTKEMFNIIESFDGYIFDSYEEKYVYEYIKNNAFEYIFPVCRKRKGNYIFKDKNSKYTKYCPDYVVEYLNIGKEKIKLDKPIIVEYYGMYEENCKESKILNDYKNKTIAKDKYYTNNKDIYYIGIYPNDIKNEFYVLNKKIQDLKNNIIIGFKNHKNEDVA